jgi:hypothetical protein
MSAFARPRLECDQRPSPALMARKQAGPAARAGLPLRVISIARPFAPSHVPWTWPTPCSPRARRTVARTGRTRWWLLRSQDRPPGRACTTPTGLASTAGSRAVAANRAPARRPRRLAADGHPQNHRPGLAPCRQLPVPPTLGPARRPTLDSVGKIALANFVLRLASVSGSSKRLRRGDEYDRSGRAAGTPPNSSAYLNRGCCQGRG